MPQELSKNISLFQQTYLLKKYEPILHFARGEKFFPMKASDFIVNSHLKRNEGKLGTTDFNEPATPIKLIEKSENYYLHYNHDNTMSIFLRIFITILLTCMIAFMWYCAQIDQFNLTALEGNDRWPPLWEGIDNLKLILVGTFLLSWSLFGGNRQVHFTLCLSATIILFSGTLLGVGFGLLSILVLIAILFIRRGVNLRITIQAKLSKLRNEYTSSRILLGVIGIVIFFLIAILLYIVVWSLSLILQFNRELTINTNFISLPSIIPLPFDFVMLISLTILISILGLTFWSALARFIRNFFTRSKKIMTSHKISIEEELLPFVILSIASILLILIYLLFWQLGLLEKNNTHGQALAFGLLAVIAASAIFWFFIDPFVIIEANLNTEATKTGNVVNNQSSNINRLMVLSLIAFLIWFFLTLLLALTRLEENAFAITAGRLIWLPFLFLLFVIVIAFLSIAFSGPQFAGFIMNLLSLEPDSTANRAERKYNFDFLKNNQGLEDLIPWYHGRVITDGKWTTLQYHYFYAYNDWRSACDGINQHEGDWEAVAIFLENPSKEGEEYTPFGVACSQHHGGDFRFWENVHLEGNSHPNIYVALGSHANYFKIDTYDTSMLLPAGLTRAIVGRIDAIVGEFRGTKNGLPQEIVNGNGLTGNRWHCQVITDEYPSWVRFKGLWGKKTRHPDESGPTGPKWNRPEEKLRGATNYENRDRTLTSTYEDEAFIGKIRPRWQLHTWKDMLLFRLLQNPEVPTEKRRRALQHLISTSQYILRTNYDVVFIEPEKTFSTNKKTGVPASSPK